MNLKERTIYQLPNGRELVVHFAGGDEPILFNLTSSQPEHYELSSEGRLLLNGRLTAWAVDDLVETGRVASLDVAAVPFGEVARSR